MSTASRKGYVAEHAVEELLLAEGYPVYRPRAGAARDCGDLGSVPLVLSVKNHARIELSTCVNDLARLVGNAGANSGVVWHKKKGAASPLDWYVSTSGRLFLPIYRELAKTWGPL